MLSYNEDFRVNNYIIVGNHDLNDLCKEVNEFIDKGYVPLGSVVIDPASDGVDTYFVQTMLQASHLKQVKDFLERESS